MQSLKNISLFQFKNYSSRNISFTSPIVCIYGKNGSGKTNLLDAIYFTCFTKSYFIHKDAMLVQKGKLGMFVQATIEHENTIEKIKLIIRENGKKELWIDDEEQKSMQKHIGKLPCIIIAPDDIAIINEGGENRRKYIDGTIAQIDAMYLQKLIQYNKYLQQRNALLKNWHESGADKENILAFYNAQMSDLANYIFTKRKEILTPLLLHVQELYSTFSNNNDHLHLQYSSKLHSESLQNLYAQTHERDILSQRTSCGVHKDDLNILFEDNNSFKETASQGQKKTLLFALKLAQFKWLQKALGKTPFLLLDDVFEKLDENRCALLLNFIKKEKCQTFITDTHLHRLQQAFADVADVQFLGME